MSLAVVESTGAGGSGAAAPGGGGCVRGRDRCRRERVGRESVHLFILDPTGKVKQVLTIGEKRQVLHLCDMTMTLRN